MERAGGSKIPEGVVGKDGCDGCITRRLLHTCSSTKQASSFLRVADGRRHSTCTDRCFAGQCTCLSVACSALSVYLIPLFESEAYRMLPNQDQSLFKSSFAAATASVKLFEKARRLLGCDPRRSLQKKKKKWEAQCDTSALTLHFKDPTFARQPVRGPCRQKKVGTCSSRIRRPLLQLVLHPALAFCCRRRSPSEPAAAVRPGCLFHSHKIPISLAELKVWGCRLSSLSKHFLLPHSNGRVNFEGLIPTSSVS